MIGYALLVDDNRIDQKLCKRLMMRSGLVGRFDGCFNAEEGLAFLQTHRVDLLIVDVNMPGLSGFDMLHQAHAADPSAVEAAIVVMLSSSIAAEDRLRAVQLGFVSRFVEKPLTAQHLEDFARVVAN